MYNPTKLPLLLSFHPMPNLAQTFGVLGSANMSVLSMQDVPYFTSLVFVKCVEAEYISVSLRYKCDRNVVITPKPEAAYKKEAQYVCT